MARYLGPKCKLSRREGTDLFLKSGVWKAYAEQFLDRAQIDGVDIDRYLVS